MTTASTGSDHRYSEKSFDRVFEKRSTRFAEAVQTPLAWLESKKWLGPLAFNDKIGVLAARKIIDISGGPETSGFTVAAVLGGIARATVSLLLLPLAEITLAAILLLTIPLSGPTAAIYYFSTLQEDASFPEETSVEMEALKT